MSLVVARRALWAVAAGMSAAAAAAADAQTVLPDARELVARHVDAIGGRDALLALRTVRLRGSFEMPSAPARGEFESVRSGDGAATLTMNLPGLGPIRSGFDGERAWAMNPIVGAALLEGRELARAKDEASLLGWLREPPLVTALQTVGVSTMAGERCHRVRVTWLSGRRTFDCYSTASGLLVGTETPERSRNGLLQVVTTYEDYRDFNGVKFATVATQHAAGQRQVQRVTTVEFNVAADDVFAPPPAVEALILRERAVSQSR